MHWSPGLFQKRRASAIVQCQMLNPTSSDRPDADMVHFLASHLSCKLEAGRRTWKGNMHNTTPGSTAAESRVLFARVATVERVRWARGRFNICGRWAFEGSSRRRQESMFGRSATGDGDERGVVNDCGNDNVRGMVKRAAHSLLPPRGSHVRGGEPWERQAGTPDDTSSVAGRARRRLSRPQRNGFEEITFLPQPSQWINSASDRTPSIQLPSFSLVSIEGDGRTGLHEAPPDLFPL
jgi:hypothetical protein